MKPTIGRRTWLFPAAFLAIASLFAWSILAAAYRAGRVQEEIHGITSNMLASVELVSRIHHDLDRVRRVVDDHIAEQSPARMASLQEQIDGLEADIDDAAREYDPLATQPGEALAWRRLTHQLAELRTPIGEALALSRKNRDGEARAAITRVDERLDAIDSSVADLVRINHDEADLAVDRVTAIQRVSLIVLAALGLGGMLFTSLVGWITFQLSRRELALGRRSEALEQRNRDLDAFAGRVAHDLRGPLTTISLAASGLSPETPGQSATTTLLRRGVDRMEVLIDDLLSLSRIDAEGGDGLCDPSLAAARIVEEAASRLEREGVALRTSVAPARVRCRQGLLQQALSNLVDNAIKYRRPGVAPEIELSGRIVGGRYELRVSDNGIGMTPDVTNQVFNPFYRALPVRQTPGTGLGLSIVKRVAEASGGKVAVHSAPGRGTTFVLNLPLAGGAERS